LLISCDLKQSDAGDRSPPGLAAEGVEVSLSFNNAGFGVFGNALKWTASNRIEYRAQHRAVTDLSLRFSIN